MKKLSIFVVAALSLVSCGKKTCDAADFVTELNTQMDSVNYVYGYLSGNMIKEQALKDSVLDEPAIKEFFDVLEASYTSTEEVQISEKIGIQIASMMSTFAKEGVAQIKDWTLSSNMLQQGLVNALNGDSSIMTSDAAMEYLQALYMQSMSNPKADESEDANKAATVKLSKMKNKVKKVELKTQNDSINYAFGAMYGGQIGQQLSDEKDQQAFVEAYNKGIKYSNPQLIGIAQQFAESLKQQDSVGLMGIKALKVQYLAIRYGLYNGFYGADSTFTIEKANEYMQTTTQNIMKKDQQAYLDENAKKEGVTVTESGLQYEVITMGEGAKPAAESTVKVHYEGKLIDGTVFDSSVQRGEPAEFPLNGVIKGWTEGVQLMPVGSKFRFTIPYYLAYGEYGNQGIPPFATLIFDVELLEIVK